MIRRLTLLVLLGAALAPGPALAQFEPLPPAPPPQQPAPAPATDPEDEGLERWQELAIFGGGVAFIGIIALVILRDARKRAPVEDERPYYRHREEERQAKGKADRKKTKAQKAARKKQRARR